MEHPTTQHDMEKMYPGFPPFVHVIMAEIANGASPTEAAAAVEKFKLKDRIESVINASHEKTKSFTDIVAHKLDSLPLDDATGKIL